MSATITVQGEHSAFHPAEKATVQISVSFDGSKRDTVFQQANASAEAVREQIKALHDEKAGPVTNWSSDRVQVWGSRPWSQDGKQLPFVYHASVSFTAKFNDFDALSKFIEMIAPQDGVGIGWISWDLTEEKRKEVTAEVRTKAVQDAAAKALSYAKAAGFKSVEAIAVADVGMLGNQSAGFESYGSPAPVMAMSRMKADAGSGPELSLKPEEIEIRAAVDARFQAN